MSRYAIVENKTNQVYVVTENNGRSTYMPLEFDTLSQAMAVLDAFNRDGNKYHIAIVTD